MAPTGRPSKRAAASVAPCDAPREKRGRKAKADPVKDQCDLVIQALNEASLPGSLQRMLVGLVPESLSLLREERHPLQEQAVTMLETACASIEQAFEKRVEELESSVQEASVEKGTRDASATAAENGLAATGQQLTQLEEALASATTSRSDTQKVLVQAESARAAAMKAQVEFTEQKEKIETTMKDAYTPTKDGMDDKAAKRRNCAALSAMGKKLKLDDSLFKALPEALKSPSDRSQFDSIILQQFEAAISDCLSRLEKSLAQGAAAVEECAAAALSAQSACDAAEEKKLKSKEAVLDSKKQEKENLQTLKAAEKYVAAFAKELSEIVVRSDAAKQELAQFREGALTSFRELKDRALVSVAIEDAATSQVAAEDEVPCDVMSEGSAQIEKPLELEGNSSKVQKIEEVHADPVVLMSLGA